MTESFARAYQRNEFGAPLPVAESLLAVSDRPLSWLFRKWENHVEIGDERSLSESVLPVGPYVMPEMFEFIDRMSDVDDTPFGEVRKKSTYLSTMAHLRRRGEPGDVTRSWDRVGALRSNERLREMTIDEMCMLALHNDGHLNGRGYQASMHFVGTENAFPKLDWVDEVSPFLFGCAVSVYDDTTRSSIPPEDEPTIGELLYAFRRCPNVISIAAYRANAEHGLNYYGGKMRTARFKGRETLLPLVGESWLSYVVLSHKVRASRDADCSIEQVVEFAKRLIDIEGDVDRIAPYAEFFGTDLRSIRSALSHGVAPDMLKVVAP